MSPGRAKARSVPGNNGSSLQGQGLARGSSGQEQLDGSLAFLSASRPEGVGIVSWGLDS
jgi:hypothetical protein